MFTDLLLPLPAPEPSVRGDQWTPDDHEAVERFLDLLEESRRNCTCEFPGQAAESCPSYVPGLDAQP